MTAVDEVMQDVSTPPPRRGSAAVDAAAVVIIVVLSVTALKVGRAVVLPIVVSVMLTLLLSAPVRWLRRKKIPERYGAAIVVFGAIGIGAAVGATLITPATEWIATAPATVSKVESKIRLLMKPIAALEQSADRMATVAGPATPAGRPPAQVQLATPSIFDRLLGAFEVVPATFSAIFLTYFLLASGPLFRRKIARILPGRRDVVQFETIVSEIEIVTSKFLATTTMINAGVGIATALSLWAVGLPSPILWGGVVGVLNFVPYVGPISSVTIITLAALASFDNVGHALIAPACFGVIHLVENNLVTPTLLGRRLPVNTVAIFLGLIFFGWVWGILGAVLAVPLTTVVKIACDHIPQLRNLGELLGN
ncbi:MAG TPA: AI-2E family transporter [Gemmatimonadaceae bacterium]|nr:AI-2E family transporter [Gemmatimonadaceae bacterium]